MNATGLVLLPFLFQKTKTVVRCPVCRQGGCVEHKGATGNTGVGSIAAPRLRAPSGVETTRTRGSRKPGHGSVPGAWHTVMGLGLGRQRWRGASRGLSPPTGRRFRWEDEMLAAHLETTEY